MLIKRDVYFSAIDEYGEERLYSTTELVNEEDYLESLYSDDEDKIRVGDRVHTWIDKNINWKKRRQAQIDMLSDDEQTARRGRHNLSKENIKVSAPVGALGGAGIGGLIGAQSAGAAGGLAGAIGGAVLGAAASAGVGYASDRVNKKISRAGRNLSSSVDTVSRRRRDQLRLANGDITKDEFKKKYGTKHLI